MPEMKESKRLELWKSNDWLEEVFTCNMDKEQLKFYYEDCKYDLQSMKESSYADSLFADMIAELQQAVNEISLVLLYDKPIPNDKI